jgi:ribosomal protein S20
MAGQGTKIKKKKKSVLKRAAQSGQRADVNRANRTRVRTLMKRLRTAVTAGDATAAGNLLQPTLSAIDRAISRACCTKIPVTATNRDLLWPTTDSKLTPQNSY